MRRESVTFYVIINVVLQVGLDNRNRRVRMGVMV